MNKKDKVIEVSKLITYNHSQIVIDIFQDDLDDLLEKEDITPDDIGSFSYKLGILIDVFNPEFGDDVLLLNKLHKAIYDWLSDREFVNIKH